MKFDILQQAWDVNSVYVKGNLVNSGIAGFNAFKPRALLRDSIAETLEAAIISGQLAPSEVYSAPRLAAQFEVSATPVREAMLELAREGLVEVLPNKGFKVTEMPREELNELSDLRELIEVPTVGKVAKLGVDKPTMKMLRYLASEIERSAVEKNLIAHSRADLEFHLTLLGVAGNETLVSVVRSLRKRSRLYGIKTLMEEGRLAETAREHHELLDAIEAGDVKGAEALMTKHIGNVRGLWSTG
jgi:DNA-binding GntR family transcriptional regulator